MPKANENGVAITYETFGSPDARPLVLVMGLGAQMLFWDEAFCAKLAERGHFVVRFDNRDCGESRVFDELGVPNVEEAWGQAMQGQSVAAPYAVEDMADDAIGLLDALGLEAAHFVGASMGGMIVQTLGWRHPDRVRSLTSIMSTTGDPELPTGSPEALAVLFRPPATSREEFVDMAVEAWRAIGGSLSQDEARIRRRSERCWDRGYYPAGTARQLCAVLAQGSRRPNLETLDVPFLVIHGTDDPLIPQACGEDTAAAVPGASLVLVEGMGHDMPPEAWGTLVDAITKHTEAAE